jgi:hypothetical protein
MVQSDTADLPISYSFSNVELFIACLCSYYIHLISIRFNSGDLVGGRNTSPILGWYMANVCFTLFDLCIDALSDCFIHFTLKSIIERTMQYIKDRIKECFDDYFPCGRKNCNYCMFNNMA